MGAWTSGHEYGIKRMRLHHHPPRDDQDAATYRGNCGSWGSRKRDSDCPNNGCLKYKDACLYGWANGANGCGYFNWGCAPSCMSQEWCEWYNNAQDLMMVAISGSGIYIHRP